ncbi:elongation factor Tu GTP-binding domain-containing protein 1-like, partial [Notothenia coriiceps]|uniref:Elongation factor Tu GTP-binding domain-containing protein 1-like n=1 Tax=Notothenia coriiceps TaxID=8208 RepID=A0A6I9P9P2_9TELE
PLTHEEIAQRRDLARQRHAEKLAADQTAAESPSAPPISGSMPQEGHSAEVSTAKMEKDSKPQEEEEQHTFVAFARIYSGVVKKGQKVFVLGPKYDPAKGLSMVHQPTFREHVPHSSCLYNVTSVIDLELWTFNH